MSIFILFINRSLHERTIILMSLYSSVAVGGTAVTVIHELKQCSLMNFLDRASAVNKYTAFMARPHA